MEINNRLLFLKYALPCATTLVRRGSVPQKTIDELKEIVSNNKEIPENSEKIFKVALAMCTLIARRQGKEIIDGDVIREYFLKEHDKVVDERFQEMGDFDPLLCKTRFGKVISVKNSSAAVLTGIGTNQYYTDFIEDLKVGDSVIVHHNFIVEKASEELIKRFNTPKR